MVPPPVPAKDDLASRLDAMSLDGRNGSSAQADLTNRFDALSLEGRKGLSSQAEFVGGFKHGPANPNAGGSMPNTPPRFPMPNSYSTPPAPGPLPTPPRMFFPEPHHYSRTMQHAMSDDPSAPAFLELEPPELPPRAHSDEPRVSKKSESVSAKGARLEVSTPKRPRAMSSPPISPIASKCSSSPGKLGDENTQCCGMTKKGGRCTRQVKALPPLNVVDPDVPTERFCYQHKKDINEQTGFYSRGLEKDLWLEFSEYIPLYLHPDTQAALRVEMEKAPSDSDVPGYIYCFEIRDPSTPFMIHLKVGRAVTLNDRLAQWKKQCGSKEQVTRGWWPGNIDDPGTQASLMKGRVQPGRKGAYCHKLERLVHLELADLVVHAPYLDLDFPNVSAAEDSPSAKVPRSNPGTPRKGGKRSGGSSSALYSLQSGGRPCRDCGTVHKEIFSFTRPEQGPFKGQEWDKFVMPVILKWGRFLEIHEAQT